MLALKAENISKQYRIGEVGTGTLSHDLNRFWHHIRGKENPYLKIGEENDRSIKGESEYVWSLKDINFEVEQGDAVGIIGKNGAGKSTLLKILSKVTKPTTGKIFTRGRIASLLEVGTGFHPEMTGRENIYLNGAILGMTRKEINKKFDEIVDFSGVERYIDTPVKRYSSGMYVRLAFGVAAHLESEILIVDEVLAVGDNEFQRKCMGKMRNVSKSEGRTVLFVSHQMPKIIELCSKSICLENGKMLEYGETETVIKNYMDHQYDNYVENKNPILNVDNIALVSEIHFVQDGQKVENIEQGKQFQFHFKIKNISKTDVNLKYNVGIFNNIGYREVYFGNLNQNMDVTIEAGETKELISYLGEMSMVTGKYSIAFSVNLSTIFGNFHLLEKSLLYINVTDADLSYIKNPNRTWRNFTRVNTGFGLQIEQIELI